MHYQSMVSGRPARIARILWLAHPICGHAHTYERADPVSRPINTNNYTQLWVSLRKRVIIWRKKACKPVNRCCLRGGWAISSLSEGNLHSSELELPSISRRLLCYSSIIFKTLTEGPGDLPAVKRRTW